MLGFLGHPKKKNRLQIFCKKCNNDLCADDSFISDTYDKNEDNHVKYKCKKCGKKSDYNFDIAPVPINWEELSKK